MTVHKFYKYILVALILAAWTNPARSEQVNSILLEQMTKHERFVVQLLKTAQFKTKPQSATFPACQKFIRALNDGNRNFTAIKPIMGPYTGQEAIYKSTTVRCATLNISDSVLSPRMFRGLDFDNDDDMAINSRIWRGLDQLRIYQFQTGEKQKRLFVAWGESIELYPNPTCPDLANCTPRRSGFGRLVDAERCQYLGGPLTVNSMTNDDTGEPTRHSELLMNLANKTYWVSVLRTGRDFALGGTIVVYELSGDIGRLPTRSLIEPECVMDALVP